MSVTCGETMVASTKSDMQNIKTQIQGNIWQEL